MNNNNNPAVRSSSQTATQQQIPSVMDIARSKSSNSTHPPAFAPLSSILPSTNEETSPNSNLPYPPAPPLQESSPPPPADHHHHQQQQQQSYHPNTDLGASATGFGGGATTMPSYSPASPVPNTSRNLLEVGAQVAKTEFARQNEKLLSLELQVTNQNRLLEAMRQQSEHKQLSGLKDELSHARNLIADLQAALKSQENTFAEMLRSQELLKTSEEARANQDRELQILRSERDHMARQLREKENALMDMREAMQRVENKGHAELERLRQAFVDYDKSVGEYVEKQRLQHLEELESLRKRLVSEQEMKYQSGRSKNNNNNNSNNASTAAPQIINDSSSLPAVAPAADTQRRTMIIPQNTSLPSYHSPINEKYLINNNNKSNNNFSNQNLNADELRNALLDLAGGIAPSGLDKARSASLQQPLSAASSSYYPSHFHPSSPLPASANNMNETMFSPYQQGGGAGAGAPLQINNNNLRASTASLTGPAAQLAPQYPAHVLEAARQHLMANMNNSDNPIPSRGGGGAQARRDRSIL